MERQQFSELRDGARPRGSARVLEEREVRTSSAVKQHRHKHNVKRRYEVLETLGEGTYGKVKRAVERQNGKPVAIKTIRKERLRDDLDRAHIQREIEITASLLHPNIIQLYEVFESRDRMVMVMEYASRGELYEYIQQRQRLSEQEARHFFRQITSAVHYCHTSGVVHRDLKLENILLDKDLNVKLADFGLSSHYVRGHFLDTFCGSPLYASPEIINGHPYQGPEVDCWSLGVLLYALVYGFMPFDGTNHIILKEQIRQGRYKTPDTQSEACSLISWMLTVKVEDRATVEDIANHWWLNLYCPATICDRKPNVSNPPDPEICLSSFSELTEGKSWVSTISRRNLQENSPSSTISSFHLSPFISPSHSQPMKLPKKGILKQLCDQIEYIEGFGCCRNGKASTSKDMERTGTENGKFSSVPLTTSTHARSHSCNSKTSIGQERDGGEQQEIKFELKISLWKTHDESLSPECPQYSLSYFDHEH